MNESQSYLLILQQLYFNSKNVVLVHVILSFIQWQPLLPNVADDGFSKLQIFLQQLIDWGVNAGGRIIGAIIIFVVGRFLISLLRKMLARLLAKRHVDASIQSFVKSLVNILLTILLIIAVIGKLGVETTSFAALLASAGVAIGMALVRKLAEFCGWTDCLAVPSLSR